MDIAILIASQGKNKELAQKLKELANEKQAHCGVIDLCDLELPLYSPKEEEKGVPDKAKELNEELKKAKSFVLVAPEYNGGIPPSMVNALTWVSRCGKDWRESFNNKPALLATHSGGGGSSVLTLMRLQFSYVGVNILGRTLLTNYNKPLNEESAHSCLDSLLKAI